MDQELLLLVEKYFPEVVEFYFYFPVKYLGVLVPLCDISVAGRCKAPVTLEMFTFFSENWGALLPAVLRL